MNNEEKEKLNVENEEKKSNSDDQNDDCNAIKEILLDLEEDPNTIIEKILIKIFNEIIMNKNEIEENFIFFHKKKVKELCIKHLKKNIILLLFVNIRNIIQKYRLKLFQIPSIVELRKNYYEKNDLNKSNSSNNKYSNRYLNFSIDRFQENYPGSPGRVHRSNYYYVVKNLFNKLKGIKNCLKKASPIIEKIFEYPLSDFENFSIIECAKEEYLKILIHDNYIWSEIVKNKNTIFNDVIQEILEGLEGDSFHVNVIENKIEYFSNFKKKSLKISKIQPSVDIRRPEEAQPMIDIKLKFRTDLKNFYDDDKISDDEDSELDIENSKHNFANINMIKFNRKNLNLKNFRNNLDIKKAIITNETINEIKNFREKLNLEKNFSFNNNNNNTSMNAIKAHSHINILNKNQGEENNINININKKRINKNIENISLKNNKKIEKKNKNKKSENKNLINLVSNEEKKEIPNDLDDLVKYIKDDTTGEKQSKKKKKNRKKGKKKNKTNINNDENNNKDNEIKIDNDISNEDKEIEEIKDQLLKDSINRYKIHKIKFKYRPYFLKKLEKNEI
jgi:hypothetical protein